MRVLGIAAALTVLVATQAVHAQSQTITDLRRAKTCRIRSTIAVVGGSAGDTHITMISDGGWCWINLTATNSSFQFVPKFTVSQAPLHGELAMGEANKRMRVAYRPAEGYVGEDAYTLVGTMMHDERKVTISVRR